MTAHSDITKKENEAIEELRERLKDDMEEELLNDKYAFLRFLRARDFNINNTEAMLRKHLEWREKYDVKNILNIKRKEVWEKYVINLFIGYDKDGCAIRYSPAGNVDYIGVLKSLTFEEVIKYVIYDMEEDTLRLKHQSKKLGRNVDQCVYLYNLENFSFATSTSKEVMYFMINFLNTSTNNYPERLKACYFINVPTYFNLPFTVSKALLPKTMISKLIVYTDDSYKEDLLKVIDADVLPEFLGGNRRHLDGDLTVINQALERVPEKYYLQNRKHLLSKKPDVKKITLSRAAFHEENMHVEETGSYIEWIFETKCRDIGFGLFYNEMIDGEEKITELIPIQRIDTEEYPETGTYRCDKPGKYVIVFDNTYSWVRQKEIFTKLKVLTPEEHQAQLKS